MHGLTRVLGEQKKMAPLQLRKVPVVVDARCYQDGNYAKRGIGRSTISLLRNCPETVRRRIKLVAVLDSRLGPMPDDYTEIFDEVSSDAPVVRAPTIFFSPSPLTHDSEKVGALVRHPKILSAAFIHDFIPYDYPGEMNEVGEYVQYSRAVALLKEYSLYFANSNYTAQRTRDVLEVEPSNIVVSKIAARQAFFEAVASNAEPNGLEFLADMDGFFVCVSGDAPRKRPETAIEALRLVGRQLSKRYALVLVGKFNERHKKRLADLSPGEVVFLEDISDEVLCWLNRNAIAAIQPSRVEGFSMPVIEGIISGALVIASNCDAHGELVGVDELLFPVDDIEQLAALMIKAATDPRWRTAALGRLRERTDVARTEWTVAERFWQLLMQRFLECERVGVAPTVSRGALPSFAFVSPYPPQKSGVAIATARGLAPLVSRAHVDLFTHADISHQERGLYRRVGSIDDARKLPGYDLVIYVLGNCIVHHGPIYDLATQYRQGDHVLLADSLMINMQLDKRGLEGAASYASRILGRKVSGDEYSSWLHRPLQSEILGMEEFLTGDWTPIVHSKVTEKVFRERFDQSCVWIPHSNKILLGRDDFEPAVRDAWRQKLELDDSEITIIVAGGIAEVKGAYESIAAIKELVDWSYRPRLIFAGGGHEGLIENLKHFARQIGVESRVRFTQYIDDDDYRFYLIAADVGLQLRKVPFGQTSGGLCDCISLGLPSVANRSMAEAIDAPDYVFQVPDILSPVLIAEQIINAYANPQRHRTDSEMRRQYVEEHAPSTFAQAFLDLVR